MKQLDSEQWQQVAERFHAFVDMPPQEQQAALALLKTEQAAVYESVVQLLAEESALHPVLRTHAPEAWKVTDDESLVGSEIGIYRLTRHLGSGGMGSVFLAERTTDDFDQTVALKLIRPGRLPEKALNRFRQERQILAKLHHPGIARLYDGGTTEEGRLYFTMERVEGQDIVTYLDNQEAGLEERIHMFLKIARAIAYAHSRLVLHLDLKPANILSNKADEVKILDFGIAERLDAEASSSGIGGSQLYTLAYGAPEQLLEQPLSTRSDIYSLGVLLYQLCVGQLPLEHQNLTLQAYKDQILTASIVPPSQHPNFVEGDIQARHLRGDLDTIVLHCLQKKPEDRYGTVEQLVGDLEAWQHDRPISLRETDSRYTLSKFVRRNQAWLTAASMGLAGLLLLGTYYTVQLKAERNQARSESLKNEELLGFVTGILQEADPLIAQGDTLTVYDLLFQARARVDTALVDQPELYVEMLHTLATIYLGLGEYEQADSLARKGFGTIQTHSDLQQTGLHARMYFLQGDLEFSAGAYQESIHSTETGLVLAQQLSLPDAEVFPYYHRLGDVSLEMSELTQADSLYRLALQHIPRSEPNSEAKARIWHAMGDLNRRMEQLDSGYWYLNAALHLKQSLYESPHDEIAYTLNHLGSLHYDLGEYDSALYYARASLAQRTVIFGEAHVETIASMGNISRILSDMGQPDSAQMTSLRMLELLEVIFPAPHPYRLGTLGHIGNAYNRMGQPEAAAFYFRQGAEMHTALVAQNPENPYSYQGSLMYHGLSISLLSQNRLKEALPEIREALRLNAQLGNSENAVTAYLEVTLGQILVGRGEIVEGKKVLLHAQKLLAPLPDKHRVHLQRITESLEATE